LTQGPYFQTSKSKNQLKQKTNITLPPMLAMMLNFIMKTMKYGDCCSSLLTKINILACHDPKRLTSFVDTIHMRFEIRTMIVPISVVLCKKQIGMNHLVLNANTQIPSEGKEKKSKRTRSVFTRSPLGR
jgi:hypothetical protein